VKYTDYYAVLGVPRTATQAEIQRAYRQLARKRHPDIDTTAGATQRFQQITEAYEVLKNPETRQRYDTLGAAWKDGQDFTPPPGWQTHAWSGASGGGPDLGQFSDFFATLFGGERGFGFDFAEHDAEPVSARTRARRRRASAASEAELGIDLASAVHGGTVSFQLADGGAARTIEVRVPAGSATGSVLRLRGQGAGGADLHLRLRVEAPAGYRADGDDLRTALRATPSEAALGARIPLRGPDGGEVLVTLPPGSSSGRTLRLRGLGLPRRDGGRGDVLAEVAIAVPERLTDEERRLYEELARASRFDPRRA
jgi:curved DNA-binding protein